ncbi:BldC family transcriptional regulator [Georgenia sp. Z1344]|uniref:BldC family transcriptional regulator n=1 Tax=Georgenia sp. Z1344 TaxID=3416706 RepID=UPI003CE9736A
MDATPTDDLMTPAEVAACFRVDPKTVTRWANAGKLAAVRTLGGHRRFRRDEVEELMRSVGLDPEARQRAAG